MTDNSQFDNALKSIYRDLETLKIAHKISTNIVQNFTLTDNQIKAYAKLHGYMEPPKDKHGNILYIGDKVTWLKNIVTIEYICYEENRCVIGYDGYMSILPEMVEKI